MKFTQYRLDTSQEGPDRSTTKVGGDVDVAAVGAASTGLSAALPPANKWDRGGVVPVLTDQDVADVLLARGALESAAIRQIIARGLMKTAYEALDKYVTEMEAAAAAGDWAAVGMLDLDFHTALVAAARSPRLQRMFITFISSEMPVCLGMVSATRSREDSVAGHRKIARAVREGDADQALSTAARELRCLS
jgi:DNA-binding GntR family transcriptional regulator